MAPCQRLFCILSSEDLTNYKLIYSTRASPLGKSATLLKYINPGLSFTCGAEMRIVAFITQRAFFDRILNHLEWFARSRGPGAERQSRRCTASATRRCRMETRCLARRSDRAAHRRKNRL